MSDKLENDLKYSIINFKQNVLLTDLILEYKLNYAEVERLVQAHLLAEAARHKYEKTYLVQGLSINSENEIITTVAENDLEAALKKLQNAQSNLYAVKISGGAKSMPQSMKPLTYATIALKDATKENTTEIAENVAVKEEEKKVVTQKQPIMSEVKKVSPVEREKKPLAEKGQIRKAASPKKLNDFFKKNATTTKTKTKPENKTVTKTTIITTKPVVANESMQLFEEEEEEDEEKKDELRRELVANPVAVDDEEEEEEYEMSKTKGSANKRRRILDSDDEEEEPQAKQDKKVAEKLQTKQPEIEPGTYLDEDGFVLTVKPKKQTTSNTAIRSSPRKPAVKSSPIKKTPKKRPSPKKAAPKTKQGSIMSFFGKK